MKDSQIIVYSRIANQLIEGRKEDREKKQFPTIGLFQFAATASIIWQDAMKKNPFADWFLIRIEKKLKAAQEDIQNNQEWIKDISDDGTGINYQPALNLDEAFTIPVNFATPQAWHAMRLIKSFDTFFMQCRQLNNVGLVSRDDFQTKYRKINRLLMSVFHEANAYQSHPLAIECLSPPSKTAKLAIKQMGAVPVRVLRGELQANFRP